jgi:hypothetical protein
VTAYVLRVSLKPSPCKTIRWKLRWNKNWASEKLASACTARPKIKKRRPMASISAAKNQHSIARGQVAIETARNRNGTMKSTDEIAYLLAL